MHMKTVIRMTSLAAIAMASSLSAQQPTAKEPATTSASAAPFTEPTVVAIFDVANTWDMETGALAAKKGTTKDIRDFGQMLVNDHRTVRQQGRDLAKELHVTPTPPKTELDLAKDHAAAMKRLESLKGPAFDRAFLEHEVAYHRAVLDVTTSALLPSIHTKQLLDFVNKVAPAFNGHMVAAQTKLDKLPK